MQIETAEQRLTTFFRVEDFADTCSLTGPDNFSATIPVLMNAITETVAIGDTDIEAAAEHFVCNRASLAGVDLRRCRQYSATIEGVVYQLMRVSHIEDGKLSMVYLKKSG